MFDGEPVKEIYVVKGQGNHQDFLYLITKLNDDNICSICMKRPIETSHHLIPRRLRTKNPLLEELRIKICKECHDKIHPESQLILMVKRLIKIILDVTGGYVKSIKDWNEINKFIDNAEKELKNE